MAEAPKPSWDMVREGKGKGKMMIVKVGACSLSLGDTYMLEGNCDLVGERVCSVVVKRYYFRFCVWRQTRYPVGIDACRKRMDRTDVQKWIKRNEMKCKARAGVLVEYSHYVFRSANYFASCVEARSRIASRTLNPSV